MCEATGQLEDETMPLFPAFFPPKSSLDKVTRFGAKIMERMNESDTSSASSSVASGSNSGKETPPAHSVDPATSSGRFLQEERGTIIIWNLWNPSADANLLGTETITDPPLRSI
jgi:hypothetical protein